MIGSTTPRFQTRLTLLLMMLCKCSVSRGSIDENNDSVSHRIVTKLTSEAQFSTAEDLAKQYGGPVYKRYVIFKMNRLFMFFLLFLPW